MVYCKYLNKETTKMKSVLHRIKVVDTKKPIRFVFVGDVHLGNANCDEVLLRDTVERIENDATAYWFDLGDRCDYINIHDPRFEADSLPEWIGIKDLGDLAKAQSQMYIGYFESIADKCLASVEGNHDFSIKKHSERNVYQQINDALEIPLVSQLGTSGIVRVQFEMYGRVEMALDVFLHHGAGGGRKVGGNALRLEELPLIANAQVYCLGHSHKKFSVLKERLTLNNKNDLVFEPLYMLNTGAFIRGQTGGYAERALLYPQGLGALELWVWPRKKKCKVVM